MTEWTLCTLGTQPDPNAAESLWAITVFLRGRALRKKPRWGKFGTNDGVIFVHHHVLFSHNLFLEKRFCLLLLTFVERCEIGLRENWKVFLFSIARTQRTVEMTARYHPFYLVSWMLFWMCEDMGELVFLLSAMATICAMQLNWGVQVSVLAHSSEKIGDWTYQMSAQRAHLSDPLFWASHSKDSHSLQTCTATKTQHCINN